MDEETNTQDPIVADPTTDTPTEPTPETNEEVQA